MDSLGGILTNGLLGNPILGRFNLFIGILIEDITPTPTVTPTITPTPTIFPPDNQNSGGGGYSSLKDNQKLVKITIMFRGREHISVHTVNDKTLSVGINILKKLTQVKESLLSVYVKMRERVKTIIKVTINGN